MEPRDTYRTLNKISDGIYKEKGSKFLAFSYPVESEEAIKEKVDELRKRYYDARHHCFAFILGPQAERYRANDDGEPSHSAGDPILGQLRSRNLTNALVVVVRYFGGTKLGVSGLINAYKTAASEALDNNEIVESTIKSMFLLNFPYEQMNAVMRLIKEFDLEVIDQEFMESCKMHAMVRLKSVEPLKAKMDLIRGLDYRATA